MKFVDFDRYAVRTKFNPATSPTLAEEPYRGPSWRTVIAALAALAILTGSVAVYTGAFAADGASGGWGPSGPPASGGTGPKNTFDQGGGGTPTGGQSGCNCLGGGGGFSGRG